jgi:2'-5' RNA ligase
MAFLGIRVDHPTGRLLSGIDVPGTKEAPSEYHITLLCFEDNWPISEIAKAMETTFDVINDEKPFLVKTKRVKCFPKREDNPAPIIAPVESKELHELHDKLAKAFDKAKIEYSKTFKVFKPHVTLAYHEKEIDEFDIDPVEWSVQELVLWGGDEGDQRLFVTFPLKTPEKHAILISKIDMFSKLSTMDPNATMKKSKERRLVPR